jgi:hypothetical protein
MSSPTKDPPDGVIERVVSGGRCGLRTEAT